MIAFLLMMHLNYTASESVQGAPRPGRARIVAAAREPAPGPPSRRLAGPAGPLRPRSIRSAVRGRCIVIKFFNYNRCTAEQSPLRGPRAARHGVIGITPLIAIDAP